MGIKKKQKKCIINKIFTILIILVIPFFIGLKIVEINKSDIFSQSFITYMEILFVALTISLAYNIIVLVKNKRLIPSKKTFAIVTMFLLFVIFEITGSIKLVYYNDDFKDWIIKTSIGSINYKYVATNIYNEQTIETVMNRAYRDMPLEDLSSDIVTYDDLTYNKVHYKNEFEEQILKHDEGQDYKIIKISGKTIGANYHYEGYMAVIYNPAKVKIAKSRGAKSTPGGYGQTLETIYRESHAKLAMNAGGFYDPHWNSNGGQPHGAVIIDGKIDSNYTRGIGSGGLIGFTKDNKLVLKRMTAQEAIDSGIRDAVDWGPYLIVNGRNQFSHIKSYTWTCQRTAIGQRKDGIVLMLVIDGLQKHSKGASYADVAQIMQKYGAINAASLDSGTSTSMIAKGKYINKPWNGYVPTYRRLPNAWIVE